MPTLTQGRNVANDDSKEFLEDVKKTLNREADFHQMARSDQSTKIAYLLAGAVLSAILTRIFMLLKVRAGRTAAGEQLGARLEQVIS
jgi:hypothetical protein